MYREEKNKFYVVRRKQLRSFAYLYIYYFALFKTILLSILIGNGESLGAKITSVKSGIKKKTLEIGFFGFALNWGRLKNYSNVSTHYLPN